MNKRRFILGIFLINVVLAPMVLADAISVSADLPLIYQPHADLTVNRIQGIKIGGSLVFLPVSLGAEHYSITYKSSGNTEVEVTHRLLDLFYNLPLPFVNIVVGVGAGIATTTDSQFSQNVSYKVDDSGLTQVFGSLGYDILPLIDLHLGVHQVSATRVKGEVISGGGTVKSSVDYSGSMISLGIKVGF